MANNGRSAQPEVGMAVVASDGAKVGEVKEVRDTGFLLSRSLLLPSIAVPHRVIGNVTADGVRLTVTSEQVDDLWWARAGEDTEIDTSGSYD